MSRYIETGQTTSAASVVGSVVGAQVEGRKGRLGARRPAYQDSSGLLLCLQGEHYHLAQGPPNQYT